MSESLPPSAGELVAILRETPDEELRNTLAAEVSLRIYKLLRSKVNFSHPNYGEDIIEETHGRILLAIFTPDSADGKALPHAFSARILLRLQTVLQRRRPFIPIPKEPHVIPQQQVDIDDLLSHVPEPKRTAFQMHLDGYTHKEIAENIHMSESMVSRMVADAKKILAELV